MINAIPPGDPKATNIIGRAQGYLGLAVNYSTVIDQTTGKHVPCLRTAYQPTPEELAKLNAGGSIVIELINIVRHPPIMVSVSDPPTLD